MVPELLSRRKILRNSAVIGGGAVVGSALTAGTAAGANGRGQSEDENGGGQGQGGVGYMSVSSYKKLVGLTEVDCDDEEDGWGDTFYIRDEAKDWVGEDGVYIDVPPSCNGNAPDKAYRGYLITAQSGTDCGEPPVDVHEIIPWGEDCCSWIFVNTNRNIRFDIEQRITNVHGPEPPEPCHDGAEPRYDGGTIGGEFGVVRVTFAPVPEGGQGGNGPP